MAYDYLRQRAIRSKRLADVFEEKAKNAIGPETAAKWFRLMDAALWLTSPDGEADYLDHMCKGDAQ